MRKSMAVLVVSGFLALVAGCSTAPGIRPVHRVDLQRYMGRWYVIAMIPTGPEKGAHDAVETYRLTPDGDICTWYRMRPDSFNAPVKLIHSTASVVSGTGNAEWRVHFYGILRLQYLIGWLKPDYSQVLVVRDARDHLWYMARTPQVSKSDYQAMLTRAKAFGYDTGKIVRVPQQWPEQGPGSDNFGGECP